MVTGAREAFGYSATRRESYHPWNRSGEASKAENRHELMEDVSVESSLHRARMGELGRRSYISC